MSASNGVIRIGRKGLKKFAIGDENDPRALPVFEVDVVNAFQTWLAIDDEFRPVDEDDEGKRRIPMSKMNEYHAAAQVFTEGLIRPNGRGTIPPDMGITTAEALDFIARLREQYDELATFFQPKLRDEQDLQDSSEARLEMRFSEEKVEMGTTEDAAL